MNSPDPSTPAPKIDTEAAASRLFAVLTADGSTASNEPPAAIAGYRLDAQTGAGGQGATWVGDKLDAEGRAIMRVAVKFMRYSASGFPRQYWSELETLAAMRLDCLARIVDSGIANGHPWIAFEYIDGLDLAEFEGKATADEIVETIARSAEALARVHDAGFVHRDIKPTNIIMRASDRAPILIDFGLACPSGSPALPGAIVGTPEFMSPEQASGERASAAGDQWSLAATALLMLTGEPPHPVLASSAEQFECARKQVARRANEIAPALPAPLAAVLDRALARDPKQRFADCRAFARALRDAQRGVMPPRARRPRVLQAVTLAAVALSAAAGAAIYWSRPKEIPARLLLAGDYPDIALGASLAVLGDFDADGLDEVAVGAPFSPGRGHQPWIELGGEIFIVNGRDIAAFARGESPVISPHIVSGHRTHAQIGKSVSAAGDMDGDALPEFSVVHSATGADGNEFAGVTIVRGDKRFASPGRTDLSNHPTREIALAMRKGPFSSVAASDCDSDGLRDLVCGAVHSDDARHGQLVVAHGAHNFFTGELRTSTVESPDHLAGLGCAVVSAEGAGRRFIIASAPIGRHELGMRGSVAVYDAGVLCMPGARPLRIITGGRENEWFGFALSAEIHDGALVLAIGAPGIARYTDDSGRACLLSIPLGELDGRELALDVDQPEGERFVQSRALGVPSARVGSGELAGHAVALVNDSWAVASPRASMHGARPGVIRIGEVRISATPSAGVDGDEFGWAVARWKSLDSTVLLIGAPRSTRSDFSRSGAVWASVITR